VRISGKVGGSVVAGPGKGTSTFVPGSLTSGSVTIAGEPDTWASPRCTNAWDVADDACTLTKAGLVLGSVAYNVPGLVAPVAPTVPNWVHYTFKPGDWTAAGFSIVDWQGSCSINNDPPSQVFIRSIMDRTTPVVIDARACDKVLFSSSAALQLKLKTNVAIISKNFGVEKVAMTSSDGNPHKLWLVVPDTSTGAGPTCASGQAVNINSTVTVANPISAMIYTPCDITNSTNSWTGQMYARSVHFNSASGLKSSPIGLPGANLTSGSTVVGPSASPATISTLVSYRELSGG